MIASPTLLCIHRDPGQLSVLRDNGYELLTTTTGQEGLQLFTSQAVDAVLIDYHLEHLDSAAVAAEIKQKKATVPIVMLTDHMELPYGHSPLCPECKAGAGAGTWHKAEVSWTRTL